MDKATKKVNPITRDFNPAVDFLQWNRVDGCIYFNTTDEDCRHIYRYVPKTESFEMLPLQEDVISSFDLAEYNPAVAAYVGGGNASVGVAYTYDVKKKTSVFACQSNEVRFGQDRYGYNEGVELHGGRRYGD